MDPSLTPRGTRLSPISERREGPTVGSVDTQTRRILRLPSRPLGAGAVGGGHTNPDRPPTLSQGVFRPGTDVREWVNHPLNLVLFLWCLGVTLTASFTILVTVGALDPILPPTNERLEWVEVSTQSLNAFFALITVLLNPTRIRTAVRLLEWRPKDVLVLRTLFCRGGKKKVNEWTPMLVVVTLLNLNSLFHYATCYFLWRYPPSTRPGVAVAVCLFLALGCAFAAGGYHVFGPLGRNSDAVNEDPADLEGLGKLQGNYPLQECGESVGTKGGRKVLKPEWQGGVVSGACNNCETFFASCCCLVCVHGANQERLGFGCRFVHMATFLLMFIAPFFIFAFAAVNVADEGVKRIMVMCGAVISVLGVIYGGYWRRAMRESYNLPRSHWCCGHAGMTDCATWLLCSWCAMCQEVRTAEHYDVIDGAFYEAESEKAREGGEDSVDTKPPSIDVMKKKISFKRMWSINLHTPRGASPTEGTP